jgi:hypothetical protein
VTGAGFRTDRRTTREIGLDVRYPLSGDLTLDLTVNTDFAQVEADDQQVNLTRFNLFFPEKREFFLEGQGIFSFGGVGIQGPNGGQSEAPVFFFSRRIGLDDGQSVPIDAGGRLTGRAGRYTIGLLNLQTGETKLTDAQSTNFTVVRLKRDILRRSSIGVLATRRSPSEGHDGSNRVAGVDATLQFYQNIQINSYYSRTATPGLSGDTESYRGQFKYAADRYGVEFDHLKVGDAFNPEVGFVRRHDFRRNYGQLRFSPRPSGLRGIRKIGWEGSVDRFANGKGELETQEILGTFRINLENGDNIDLNHSRNEEVLLAPFQIASSVGLGVGRYRFNDTRLNYQMGPQRPFTGTLTASRGSFYSGHKTELSYNGRVELTSQFALEPRLSLNWVDLPEGNFTARVISTRTTFTATPRMFVAALLQYNSSSSVFGTNIRFRWEYQPGSDLFVVFSEGRDTFKPGSPELMNRSFVVKFTRLFRF